MSDKLLLCSFLYTILGRTSTHDRGCVDGQPPQPLYVLLAVRGSFPQYRPTLSETTCSTRPVGLESEVVFSLLTIDTYGDKVRVKSDCLRS